jgi:hypothetical protein
VFVRGPSVTVDEFYKHGLTGLRQVLVAIRPPQQTFRAL